jgi:D-3-phosphoglycerate dehydrogenase
VKVYVPQAVAHEGTDFLKEKGYEVVAGTGTDLETMKNEIADCDAMLIRTAKCPAELLEAGKKLQIVARHGVGYDNIDLNAAERQGIWVTNTPQALSDSVAEFTLTMLLVAGKNVLQCSDAMRRGDYQYKNTHKGFDMLGKTLGILGFGRIGRKVAEKVHAGLGMRILAYDPCAKAESIPDYVTLVSWDEIFEQSDFVSVHIPGGDKNRDAIGAKEFKLMKPTAAILNVARGEVLDDEALNTALKQGELRLAVLDVQKQEPPTADWPLYQNDRVILTPHMASNTEECMGRMALHAAWQIDKVLSGGRPDWAVNHPLGLD